MSFSKELGAKVDVSQVVTDDNLISRITSMDAALFKKEAESDFWQQRLASSDAELWRTLDALRSQDPIPQLQKLLGFSTETNVSRNCIKISDMTGNRAYCLWCGGFRRLSRSFEFQGNEVDDLSNAFDNSVSMNGVCKDSMSAARIANVLIAGEVNQAAELCLKTRRFAEALFLADYAQNPVLKENVRKEFLNANRGDSVSARIRESCDREPSRKQFDSFDVHFID